MYASEDIKRGNKSKHSKGEIATNAVLNYLQRRNYNITNPLIDISKDDLQIYSSVENEISNPNSVLYRCYNCDPTVIDSNFAKFLKWIKELDKEENVSDLEQLIGPLFCHLYLDILQGGHPEKAAAFFLTHLAAVENSNQDQLIQDLVQTLSAENSSDYLTQEFRSNKYVIQMREESKQLLMNFVSSNCHIIILQELQTWFEIQISNNDKVKMELDMIPNECCLSSKFKKILDATSELENSNYNSVYSVSISNVLAEVNCGLLSRYHGWYVYNQDNLVYVNSLHNMNRATTVSDADSVRLNGHSSKVYTVTISKHYLATASSNGDICIYSNDDFEVVKQCSGHTRTVYCLKISSNEFYLASGSEDNTIRLWSIGNGELLRIFVGHLQAVISVDFHPNCLYLISGSCDNTLRLWKVEDATCIRLLHGNEGTIRSVSCHPQGKVLVSAGDDRYIRIWDILTGKVLNEMKCREAFCKALRWSKDGKQLCGAFSDGSVRVWDAKIQDNGVSLQGVQVIDSTSTIIDLEYCFGTFGLLTIK